ncbi:unnamed protein product [Phytophthora fragariaefolia]|uniref:Unnamed protein product n=1 Tax=Phytophthora fragariaefolia TaxID=1490495 RepID=A0A9W6X0U2_9STRA|nr:unnamed protein product [Phytophthora fragariaefolia]
MSAAAKELKVGQLIHEDDFKLFDSMSALELMDPKMDSGMLVNGVPPQSIAARLEGAGVPLEFASARDVLATLDELFCCEAGWLNGLPLAQSLLTSVYLHRDPLNALVAQLVTPLENLVEAGADVRAVLKESVGNSAKDSLLLIVAAVFLATLKTADLVRDAALRADIYEEEDFSPGSGFDVGVLAPISVEALDMILQVTQERLEVLLEQHKAASSKKSSKKKHGKKASAPVTNNSEGAGASTYELLYPNARVGASLCEAFIRRVQLRRELLATYAGLGLAEGTLDLKQAREGFHRAYELVQGMATERLELNPECFSGKSFGFDPSISRLLLSGSPPRDVKIPSVDEAIVQTQKVLEEMVIGCSPPEWTCMEDLRIFLVEFSRQQPTIVARSYVLVSPCGWVLPSLLAKLLTLFNSQCCLQRSTGTNGVSVWISFSCCNLIFVCALDRYLDYLEGSRLQNLSVTWTFVEKMKEIMPSAHRHGQPSQEQQTDETSATPAPPLSETSSTSSSSSAKSSKKGKAKHKKHHNAATAPSNTETPESVREPVDLTKARFLREVKYTEMLRSLMRAYFQLFNALEREGLVQVKPPMYSTHTIRFQRRFAAFQKLHFPAALTYEDFSKNSDFSPYELELIYKSVEECFKVARAHAEALLNDDEGINTIVTDAGKGIVRGFELQSLLKVSISNCVRLAQRSQHAAGSKAKKASPPSKTQMEFDFSIHPHFPVAVFPAP